MMRKQHLLRTAALLFLLLGWAVTSGAQGYDTLDQHGVERTYTVRLPAGYEADASYPVVIALHGYGGSAIRFQTDIRLDDMLYDAGWISVFPDGINNAWYFLDEDEMLTDGAYQNDVEFLNLLLDDLEAKYAVDRAHVYLVGFSNGGLMALRAGCDLRDRLAGIVAIAANYSFELAQHCLESVPLAEMLIWGSDDEVFPFNGFAAVSEGVLRSSFSQNQLRSYLASKHGCQPESVSVETANSTLRVLSLTFTRCNSGQPALVYLVGNMAHGWMPSGIEISLLQPDQRGDLEDAVLEFLQIVNENTPGE